MDASIVIATRNRSRLLSMTLTSLASACDVVRDVEVIVADHGSSDDTKVICESPRANLAVQRIDVPYLHESIAAPKNAGVAAANGRIIIFVDAGMICSSQFVAQHLAAHRSHRPTVAVGAVYGWDAEDESGQFWTGINPAAPPPTPPQNLTDPRPGHWQVNDETPWMLAWGANISTTRQAFLDAGGFDPLMTGWGWDDLELAYRLTGRGEHISYAPDAFAYHYPHPRSPINQRMKSARTNWLHALNKHRDPRLETWDVADYWSQGVLQRKLRGRASSAAFLKRSIPAQTDSFVGRRLLFGFGPGELQEGDLLALPPHIDSGIEERAILRTFGLRTWLPDKSMDVAEISPSVLAFDWATAPGEPNIAAAMLAELDRVSARVVVACQLASDRLAVLRLKQLAYEANIHLDVRSA